MPGVAGRLQPGVGRKRFAVFDHLEVAGEVGQRPQLHADRPQQVGQFHPLLAIGSAEDEHGEWREMRGEGCGIRGWRSV